MSIDRRQFMRMSAMAAAVASAASSSGQERKSLPVVQGPPAIEQACQGNGHSV